MFQKISTLQVRDQFFVVGKYQGGYVAINKKDIDSNGRLKRALNGLQMNFSFDFNTTIQNARIQVETEYLIAGGMDKIKAMMIASGLSNLV